ncbi:FAD-dependent oxidoreductase, partial [Kitasatospora indigofera]|uniref:FAD-dependent oxidoreductase n=1 Tax=Kitasatospora indigofera TaxID=67307 RepID=UPI00369EF38C
MADTKQAAFWLDDVERPRYPRLDGELTADLAIVGGGYTGLWSAVLAKQRNPGASVVLLEGKRIGWAASGRNGGFCEASLTHGR